MNDNMVELEKRVKDLEIKVVKLENINKRNLVFRIVSLIFTIIILIIFIYIIGSFYNELLTSF